MDTKGWEDGSLQSAEEQVPGRVSRAPLFNLIGSERPPHQAPGCGRRSLLFTSLQPGLRCLQEWRPHYSKGVHVMCTPLLEVCCKESPDSHRAGGRL